MIEVVGGDVPFSALAKHLDAHTAEVILCGELDLAAVPVLADEVATALAPGPRLLLLDFSAVTFLGSCGISAMIEAQQRAKAQAAQLHVFGATHHAVRRALDLTGAATFLTICPSRDDALAHDES
ncbi:STAS domain-containing protein [Amycolatopsis sp. NPDC059027]|uniref:STAS domain-containing protein n=1 Tax=unclassified Amycolatopsis TaxID=2618356 RepID=UPI00366BBD62